MTPRLWTVSVRQIEFHIVECEVYDLPGLSFCKLLMALLTETPGLRMKNKL